MTEAEFETDSSVRGYHVYQDNWTPVIGERLHCERYLFSNCEAGKVSMVKHSRFAKIRENRESFPLECFDVYGMYYTQLYEDKMDFICNFFHATTCFTNIIYLRHVK